MAAQQMIPVSFLGTGLYVPPRVVTNAELCRTLDTSDEWIQQRTGIRERRYLEMPLSTSDMCIAAAREALEAAAVDAGQLDAVILSTITPDQPLPSTALQVAAAIGATRAMPIDLTQAACAGGVLSILLGVHMLQNPALSQVLVIGGETLSRVTDPTDRGTRVFFGDAAGAVVLGRPADNRHGLLSWDIQSELSYDVQIPAGGASAPAGRETVDNGAHYLQMNGRAVWDRATEQLPKCINDAIARAGLSALDIRHFIIHQANKNIVDEVISRLGAEPSTAAITVDRLGNTGSATVFTVLHTLIADNRIRPGDPIVIAGIGAGFIWGALCLRFG